jgi:hypothetical protein
MGIIKEVCTKLHFEAASSWYGNMLPEPYIGWACVGIGFVHPCIQLQIGVKLFGCMEYANQEAVWAEASDNE